MTSQPNLSLQLLSVGSGRPLVLLHALPVTKNLFDKVQPPIGCRLLLPDFPGFGGTDLLNADFSFSDLSHSLQTALKNAGCAGPIVLGGVSMGGYWAMEFLRLFPELVERVLFIATRANAETEDSRRKRLELAEKLSTMKIGELTRPNLLGKTTLREHPDIVEKLEREVTTVDPRSVAFAHRVIADRVDQTDTLKELTVPGLWMAGGEDPVVTLEEARSFAALSKHIRLVEFPTCGHLIPWEDPTGFQAQLDGFLRG
jgi:pimeloyl-ACP methyl ester carboxylesterase